MKDRVLLAIALLVSAEAGAQRTAAPHPGLAEFSRICLEPRTIEFAMAPEEAERLGFVTEPNTSRISDEDAARFNMPENERTSTANHAIILHGDAPDPDAYSIWYAPEKTEAVVQRVDVGRGVFGAPGFAAPATFCSVVTMSDSARAWASLPRMFPDALYVGETESWLFGRMKSWVIELPWAEGYAAIVTVADYRSGMMKGVRTMPDAALFTIEVVTQKDFERLGQVLESHASPI
jgi:hypothetical protein